MTPAVQPGTLPDPAAKVALPLDQFDYDLPQELIAQQPLVERDQARLLVMRREDGTLVHQRVCDLPELLDTGDLLVLNNTRVLAARLLGIRERTGGRWEGLFLRETEGKLWELMCRTRGRVQEGERIRVEPGPLFLRLRHKTPERHWLAEPEAAGPAEELLARHGQVPLPPYIRKGQATTADRERYQTVFAESPGAVAAPTAGLHFTPALLERLTQRGVELARVTLHVGAGTFQPIQCQDVARHVMHCEWGELPPATVAAIQRCRGRGNRVVAIGTTTVRVLESVAATGPLRPWAGETRLFIRPPHEFKLVDAMLTNFHLPRSSLIVLVSAFAGREQTLAAYQTAIAAGYRFYSYGDAMLIL